MDIVILAINRDIILGFLCNFVVGHFLRIYYAIHSFPSNAKEKKKKGGKVKSEAGMGLQNLSLKDSENPRYFHFDNTFTLFLKEKENLLPYLAIQIDDINKFMAIA